MFTFACKHLWTNILGSSDKTRSSIYCHLLLYSINLDGTVIENRNSRNISWFESSKVWIGALIKSWKKVWIEAVLESKPFDTDPWFDLKIVPDPWFDLKIDPDPWFDLKNWSGSGSILLLDWTLISHSEMFLIISHKLALQILIFKAKSFFLSCFVEI